MADTIDFNRLTERELLILLAKDVKELKATAEELETEVQSLKIEVNTLKTMSKLSGGVFGFIAAVAAIIIEGLITNR